MLQCNETKEQEDKCRADVLSSNMNTYVLRNYGWVPSSWANQAYTLWAGPEGLQQKKRESVKFARFRDLDKHQQQEALKSLKLECEKNVDDNKMLECIQHLTLIMPGCLVQRVAHSATITEAIMNTCNFKNRAEFELVDVEEDAVALPMNQYDVDFYEQGTGDLALKDLSFWDNIRYRTGFKNDVDIIYDQLKAKNALFFDRDQQCREFIQEKFQDFFAQDLKASTELDFETKIITDQIVKLQKLLDTGRVLSLPAGACFHVDGDKVRVPIFDPSYDFKQNFYVQVPAQAYHALMQYFESEQDDDASKRWIDLTRTLHCDTILCRVDQIFNFFSLVKSGNNPMSMYIEAKSAQMKREIRDIVGDKDNLDEIVDIIVVLKTMWRFFKEVESPEFFSAHGQSAHVSVASDDHDFLRAFKQHEWGKIKTLFSVLLLTNRAKHMSAKTDPTPKDNLALLVEFLYGELSIFNEVIRINFLTHNAEVDELDRPAGVMQQFPWFAIQKMLETKQASLVSQKLVESTLYSNFLDSDLGAFLVFIALLLFLYRLLGCPFQSVIEQVLKEIVRIGGVSTAAIVEIAKEAVVAKIRRSTDKNRMDRPVVTYVEDSPSSGQLAIENALDTSPGTVDEQTPPVTLDSYLQALRARLKIDFDKAGIYTDFGYQYLHDDEFLHSQIGMELNLPEVLAMDSVVDKIVKLVKVEEFKVQVKAARPNVNLAEIRRDRIQGYIAKLLQKHGIDSTKGLDASIENLQEGVAQAELKKNKIANEQRPRQDPLSQKVQKAKIMKAQHAEKELRQTLASKTALQAQISELMQRIDTLGRS